MILGGKISIYVLNKKSEEGDETVPLDQIGTLNEKGQLDRSKLGIFVTHLGKDRKSTWMIVKWLWRFQMKKLYYVDFGKDMYFGFFFLMQWILLDYSGTGVPFGDVALMSEDCVRTATIIAEEVTDLLVVDRALYNRAVKEVLAKEYEDKVAFINNNPLFSAWTPRYKKQLTMAMFKEEFTYNTTLVKQGDPVEVIYFLIRYESFVRSFFKNFKHH